MVNLRRNVVATSLPACLIGIDVGVGDTCAMDADCAMETQAMFGPDLMVAPQLHLGATSRMVYLPRLPSGQVWQYWFGNGSVLEGGSTIIQPTPLTTSGEFPLYRRVNSTGPKQPFSRIGNGYCVDGAGQRPASFLCDDSGGKGLACPLGNESSCAAMCWSDTNCTGFMVQSMAIYGRSDTCNLITPQKPSAPGVWISQNAGNGYSIEGHDSEIRDTCYKKEFGHIRAVPPG